MKKLFTLTFLTLLGASALKAQSNAQLAVQPDAAVQLNQTSTQPSGVATGVQSVEQLGQPTTVFPNPAVGEFNINVGGTSTLILFNDIMQQAMEMHLNPGSNHVQTSLATGLYYYIIHSPNQPSLSGHLILQ